MFSTKQKRLLALDGGGVLGVISVQALIAMEDQLRALLGGDPDFRLRDFFDYIGGTSTGAILAAGLSIGKSARELETFYTERAEEMFDRAAIWNRLRHRYRHSNITKTLRHEFFDATIAQLQDRGVLRDDRHLLVVTRNVETDSPWPISTNPKATYNDRTRADCNLNIPLWQLVRASTAAPTFFAPERLQWDPADPDKQFFFEDGGVTPYNNPAFLLYKMATKEAYSCNWPEGEDRLMLVSVGTGSAFRLMDNPHADGEGLASTAMTIPAEMMRAASVENDINCRTFGRCVAGAPIDRELGDMIPADGADKRAFLYARYDADLSAEGLAAMGLDDVDASLMQMDSAAAVPDMVRVGRYMAKSVDLPNQFPTFMPE
ncbi:MAG: patatin-like phospholipase family protein [Pseudomonadota bacterium]